MAEATPLGLFDLVSVWMDTAARPQDFLFTATVPGRSAQHVLQTLAGAAEAFPLTRARLRGGAWVPGEGPALLAPDDPRFELGRRMDLAADPPVLQSVLQEPDGVALRFRAHHALTDLAGFLAYLDAALGGDAAPGTLRLRTHPAPRRKQRHAHPGPARRLWTRGPAAGPRRHRTVRRPAAPDEARARALQISHNDLLAAAFLEALAQLQRARGAPTRRLGLWLPMNVRVAPFEGFGNGTSRLRLYRDAAGLPEDAPFSARAQALSAQRQDAIEDGEWAVPAALPGPAWARPLVQPALRAYLARPWVDMGSAPFSHAGRLGPPGRLASLVPGAVVMNLHPWHPVGMAGLTHDGETHLTLTWDAAQLAEEDVDLLAEAFDARLEA